MLKHVLFASLGALMTVGAYAADAPDASAHPRGPRGDFMQHLTADQRACIEKFGCKMPTRPDINDGEKPSGEMPAPGDKPHAGPRPERPADDVRPGDDVRPADDGRPEMTADQRQNMECIQNAMKECGIEMPPRPEMPHDGATPDGAPERNVAEQ